MKKIMKALTTGLAALLAATALACAVPSAANAAGEQTTLVLSAESCVPQGESKARVVFTWNFVPNSSPTGPLLDGKYGSDVADTYVEIGIHTYTYYVIDDITGVRTDKGPFTFEVEPCKTVVTPLAPVLNGNVLYPPSVEGVLYRDDRTDSAFTTITFKDGEKRCVSAVPASAWYTFSPGAETRWCLTYQAPSFLDVPSTHPFATEIAWMAAQGITTGYEVPGGREFRPYGTVGRDAMAAFLYRFAGSPEFSAPSTSPFMDVPTSHPFYKEISWLASTGVSTGWDVGGGKKEFRPSQPIARDAMAAFLYRFAGKPDFTAPGTSSFTDVPMSHPFYTEISWLASTGVTTGWDVGGGKKEFRPSLNITRDAMAAFLYRYNTWLD